MKIIDEQKEYEKLKKINEYAKSLGCTIYRIQYGINNNSFLIDDHTLNPIPQEFIKDIFKA